MIQANLMKQKDYLIQVQKNMLDIKILYVSRMHTSQYPRHLKPKRIPIQNPVIEPPLLDDDRSDTTKCSDKALSGSQFKISNSKN